MSFDEWLTGANEQRSSESKVRWSPGEKCCSVSGGGTECVSWESARDNAMIVREIYRAYGFKQEGVSFFSSTWSNPGALPLRALRAFPPSALQDARRGGRETDGTRQYQ